MKPYSTTPLCRVPRFLTHVADEHGPQSVLLLRNLLDHGRLRCGAWPTFFLVLD